MALSPNKTIIKMRNIVIAEAGLKAQDTIIPFYTPSDRIQPKNEQLIWILGGHHVPVMKRCLNVYTNTFANDSNRLTLQTNYFYFEFEKFNNFWV